MEKPEEMKQFVSLARKYSENWQFESTFRPLNDEQSFCVENFVDLKIFNSEWSSIATILDFC